MSQQLRSSQVSRYSESFLILLPGFLAVLLFLIASGAARSFSDRQGLLLPANASAPHLPTAPRMPVFLSPDNQASELNELVEPHGNEHPRYRLMKFTSSLTPLNREVIFFELPLAANNRSASQTTDLINAIPQLLARRAEGLDLQITLRVSPENLATAVTVAETAAKSANLSGDLIAVGTDPGINVGVLRIEVSRSVILSTTAETAE